MKEDQQTISVWADETFGHAYDELRCAVRANEEMAELLHSLSVGDFEKAKEELADVHIVLARVGTALKMSIAEEVDKKMAVNRARIWKVDQTGHGYHVKE